MPPPPPKYRGANTILVRILVPIPSHWESWQILSKFILFTRQYWQPFWLSHWPRLQSSDTSQCKISWPNYSAKIGVLVSIWFPIPMPSWLPSEISLLSLHMCFNKYEKETNGWTTTEPNSIWKGYAKNDPYVSASFSLCCHIYVGCRFNWNSICGFR